MVVVRPRSRHPRLGAAWCATTLLAAACTTGAGPEAATVDHLMLVSGANRSFVVSTAPETYDTVTIQALDASGQGVRGVHITWRETYSPEQSNGSTGNPDIAGLPGNDFSAGGNHSTTDASGMARADWRLQSTRVGLLNASATVDGTSTSLTFSDTAVAGPPADIVITHFFINLYVGGQAGQLDATVYDAFHDSLPGEGVTWTSVTPSVARVSATGLVTALAYGHGLVTASDGAVSSSYAFGVCRHDGTCPGG